MCIVCDSGGLVLHDEAGGAPLQPFAALNVNGRGGTGPNGKPSFTPEDAGDQITRIGATWNGSGVFGTPATVTYAFRANAPATMPNGTAGFSQFNATQIVQAELALQSWADVANLNFVRVGGAGYSDSAQMLFANYSSGAAGAAAFAYYPGSGLGGDSWYNITQVNNANPGNLNYGRQTLTHEIGHALGLGHPGDYNAGGGPISYTNSAIYYEDSRQYTVMSYWHPSNTGGDFGNASAAAPLLDDIMAVQRLYGANMTTRTGNDVYGFNSNTGRDFYTAANSTSKLIFAAWDAGGNDTFDFSGYTQNQLIELRAGFFSNVGGLTGNVIIAIGAVIENAIGGSGDDTLLGNPAANRLDGGAGADYLGGGRADDIYLVDNAGDQVVEYDTADGGDDLVIASVSYTLSAFVERLTLTGAAATGTGNASGNTLIGNAAANTLSGLGGADVINGYEGADIVDGGEGNDVVLGGQNDDQVFGGAGDDVIGGGLGADLLDGGAGRDLFIFPSVAQSPFGGRDVIQNFVSGEDLIDLRPVRTGVSDTFTLTVEAGYTVLTVDLGGDGVADMQIAFSGLALVLASDILF